GYRHPGGPIRPMAGYEERRVTEAAMIMMCLTLLTTYVSQVLYADEIRRRTTTVGGGMSGAMVIVIFFGTVHRYGSALALLLYWRRQSFVTLMMVLFGVFNYVTMTLFQARRGPAIEFAFIVLLTFAMVRRKQIPAVLIAILFIGGTLWSTAIGEFREHEDKGF